MFFYCQIKSGCNEATKEIMDLIFSLHRADDEVNCQRASGNNFETEKVLCSCFI